MTTITKNAWPTFDPPESSITLNEINAFHGIYHQNRMACDGYTIIPSLIPNYIFDELNRSFDSLNQANIQPVGIVTHPLFWELTKALDHIVKLFLKESYIILPETWAWDIPQTKDSKGWAAHREKLFSTVNSDNMPRSLSIWIPITPATPENSCMYVLPACDDPNYPTGPTKYELPVQSIRALPANPGDVIVFNHNILHWGSQSSQWAANPRRALAYECQIASEKPYNTPTFNPKVPPSYEAQIELYHQLIQQYNHINY